MSTIYSWAADMTADATGSLQDFTLIYDTSTGFTKKCELHRLAYAAPMAFYGETAVAAQTMTATAVTALAAATISAANAAGVFCFGSSTVAKAYAKRVAQIQVDLEVLMGKVNSTGLVAISGL